MIEIVNNKNKEYVNKMKRFSLGFSFKFLRHNSSMDGSKMTSAKIKRFSEKVFAWCQEVSNPEDCNDKFHALEMSYDMMQINLSNLEEKKKRSVSSLFSNANSLFEYIQEAS